MVHLTHFSSHRWDIRCVEQRRNRKKYDGRHIIRFCKRFRGRDRLLSRRYGGGLAFIDLGHVKNIGVDAFAYCYYLNEVNFYEQGIVMDSLAFYMTKNLKKMYIPSDSSIGFYAFGYSGLETLIMGENTTLAKEGAFSECYDLQVINLPEGMETLKGGTFWRCYDLQKLYIPKTMQAFEKNCLSYTSLELYTWNEIEDDTFSDKDMDCTVVSLEDHVHSFKEVTFMVFDTWMVTGKYCKECSAVEDVRKVEKNAETIVQKNLK